MTVCTSRATICLEIFGPVCFECTLPAGHEGRHEAVRADGRDVIESWNDAEADALSDAVRWAHRALRAKKSPPAPEEPSTSDRTTGMGSGMGPEEESDAKY